MKKNDTYSLLQPVSDGGIGTTPRPSAAAWENKPRVAMGYLDVGEFMMKPWKADRPNDLPALQVLGLPARHRTRA